MWFRGFGGGGDGFGVGAVLAEGDAVGEETSGGGETVGGAGGGASGAGLVGGATVGEGRGGVGGALRHNWPTGSPFSARSISSLTERRGSLKAHASVR